MLKYTEAYLFTSFFYSYLGFTESDSDFKDETSEVVNWNDGMLQTTHSSG